MKISEEQLDELVQRSNEIQNRMGWVAYGQATTYTVIGRLLFWWIQVEKGNDTIILSWMIPGATNNYEEMKSLKDVFAPGKPILIATKKGEFSSYKIINSTLPEDDYSSYKIEIAYDNNSN